MNTMLPVTAYNLLESIELLASASRIFARRCVVDLQADVEKCHGYVERSLAMCTALAPLIGYDKAARIAKTAYETGRTVREVALEKSGLDRTQLAAALDPKRQAGD